MDAKSLFRQGVIAIRDEQDPGRGQALLFQSLQLDPDNDQAWLWLTRTVRDPRQRLEYVERALLVNPENRAARQLQQQLRAHLSDTPAPTEPTSSPGVPVVAPDSRYKTVAVPTTEAERTRIDALMTAAEMHLETGQIEDAIAQWVDVLNVRVDHELALRNAAGHLWRLGYRNDAHELVQRALDAGTAVPSIFLTAIDMAQRLGNHDEAENLRIRIAALPDADPQLLVKIADTYVQAYQLAQAIEFLELALTTQPDSQPLLVRMGELYEQIGQQQRAMQYLDRAVRLGTRSAEGKAADQKLAAFVPVLTDRERGSVILALRETLGIVVIYLALAWHDAGLNLLHLGIQRWSGVLMSILGAYLLVTATSSPQQRGIAEALGGVKPYGKKAHEGEQKPQPGRALQDPTALPILSDEARIVLGTTGALLLMLAFYMVFYASITLVVENPPPYLF